MQDDQRIIHLWQETLEQAFLENATDVHIEAQEEFTHLRFRVDGSLRTYRRIKVTYHEHLCAHIKVLAQLDIAEKRLPQDGRLNFTLGLTKPANNSIHKIDCRVSTLPTIYGEKIVVRLLTNAYGNLRIEQLGYDPEQLLKVQSCLNAPQGLILVTGPTGSGKTLTLYTFLALLNDGTRNISTVEDPPEIMLSGVNQVAVNEKSGMDFAKSLRAMLRQDPDIIMIGEIRDSITAQTALQAAQTGHLVLATLHTNSCVSTITRLRYLGCEKDVLAQSLLLVTAQRLLRKKCTFCTSLDASCSHCQNTRYLGRFAVHEVLKLDTVIRDAIENEVYSNHLLKLAQDQGMSSLLTQSELYVKKGITTANEVLSKIGYMS
jgi:type IV pilus assembly protein PilB